MKCVLTYIRSVKSHADGRFDASVFILCIDKLLKEFGRRFAGFKLTILTASFITHPFQDRDISENLYLLYSRRI
jgi:hypothetical protein